MLLLFLPKCVNLCRFLCLPPFTGIFLSNELWHNEQLKGKSFEFKIWSLPAIEPMKAMRVAHLLNVLPLPASKQNATVELHADTFNRSTQFESALKSENLCFKAPSQPSGDKISVFVGDAEFMSAQRFPKNASLIIVPLSAKDFVMAGE